MSNEVVQIRDAEIVAAEINTIKNQTKRLVLSASVEIGRRLEEAKSLVDHGQWKQWLEKKVDYSQSTADNLMRISREYGDEQIGLFSNESKSQTFANLSYSQAVALFALPANSREEFVQANNVEDMTARQLQEAVKAQKAAEAAKADAEKERDSLRSKVDELALDADKQAETVEALQKEIEAAKKSVADPSPAELKKMRAEIREKVKAEYEKKSEQLTLEKKTAEEKAQEIEKQYQEQLKKMELDNQAILARQQVAEKSFPLPRRKSKNSACILKVSSLATTA